MLKLAALILVVVLVLVGALMPLKYTARMQLPKRPGGARQDAADGAREDADGTSRPD